VLRGKPGEFGGGAERLHTLHPGRRDRPGRAHRMLSRTVAARPACDAQVAADLD